MATLSAFGWTLLSREALKKAETQIKQETEGVRDEIGFLSIHQAYSDRFFPGTSVLHTRLRYLLFVPWLYERIAHHEIHGAAQASKILQDEETDLAGRLKRSGEKGVIGGGVHPHPTAQPPSMAYWTALITWGFLKPNPDGSYPSRADVARLLQSGSRRQRHLDDDKAPIHESRQIFIQVPRPPKVFESLQQNIGFCLEPGERKFLKKQLQNVPRPEDAAVQSLLARMARTRLPYLDYDDIWSPEIEELADDDDRVALIRAQQASALAAIGRGVYAALVEEIQEQDGLEAGDLHRSNLSTVIDAYSASALQLQVDELAKDSSRLVNSPITPLLLELQDWLRTRGKSVIRLRPVFEKAEFRRKGARARLPNTLMARRRRAEWSSNTHTMAEPLHFRWRQVRRLLADLHGLP